MEISSDGCMTSMAKIMTDQRSPNSTSISAGMTSLSRMVSDHGLRLTNISPIDCSQKLDGESIGPPKLSKMYPQGKELGMTSLRVRAGTSVPPGCVPVGAKSISPLISTLPLVTPPSCSYQAIASSFQVRSHLRPRANSAPTFSLHAAIGIGRT